MKTGRTQVLYKDVIEYKSIVNVFKIDDIKLH